MKKKECPFCGEDIAENAKKCPYCCESLTDADKPIIIEADSDDDDDDDFDDDFDDDEDYLGIDDPREREKICKEERDFHRTLFSRIAGLIAQYNGESYWYQIFEKYEVWMILLIVLIVDAVILSLVASVGWLFNICSPLDGIKSAVMYTAAGGSIAGFILIIDADNKSKGKGGAESGELTMVLYSLGARVIQFIFLLSPVYFVYLLSPISYDAEFRINGWGAYFPVLLLSLLLYIGYIRFYIWTGGEIKAYKTWICNIGCGNYDFLHSNRFRYWNSLAVQEADMVNMRYLHGYRFISLRCMMLIPAASLFFSILMMTARPDEVKNFFNPKSEQVQSSADAKQTYSWQSDAAQMVQSFYKCYVRSLDNMDYDEAESLKKVCLTKRLYQRLEELDSMWLWDSDPFLKMQDWSEDLTEKLKVEKESSVNGIYRVYLWDGWEKSYRTVRVRVKNENGIYLIDELLDLNY